MLINNPSVKICRLFNQQLLFIIVNKKGCIVKGGAIMEYVWYVIAALGAGIGTGLAGLSAATVMVSILMILCPLLFGEVHIGR